MATPKPKLEVVRDPDQKEADSAAADAEARLADVQAPEEAPPPSDEPEGEQGRLDEDQVLAQVNAQLQRVDVAMVGVSNDVQVEYKFEIDSEDSQALIDLIGQQKYEALFDGKTMGEGARIRRVPTSADADEHAHTTVVIRMPMTATKHAGRFTTMVKKSGTLEILRTQQEMKLEAITTAPRAE